MEVSTKILRIFKLYIVIVEELDSLKIIDRRRVRVINIPECVSEYIAHRSLDRCGITTNRHVKFGDLSSEFGDRVEIKCVVRDGPMSFGPKERWESLYIY